MIEIIWKNDKGESQCALAKTLDDAIEILYMVNAFTLPFSDEVLLRKVHLVPYDEELGE